MVVSLASIPMVVLGTMGHFGMPVDIIASPAANVALAMGVDAMIHLVIRARLLANGVPRWDDWRLARQQLWQPITSAAFIISLGFGIFGLSTFPPTQRFGIAVIIGTLSAAVMAIIVVPFGVLRVGGPAMRAASDGE